VRKGKIVQMLIGLLLMAALVLTPIACKAPEAPPVVTPPVAPPVTPPAATPEAQRYELAQKYKNAEPGESFVIGYITWGLAQEYLMMCWQVTEQASKQLGLGFVGAVAESDPAWIETTESMIAAGAKGIIYNCPSAAVLPELSKVCNENNVFMATIWGYTGDMFPGDFGPRWVVDNSALGDEQTYLPLTLLFQEMREDGKTKLLHHQAHKTVATGVSSAIQLGVFQAWKNYPEMEVLGHQYGEWAYEGGRAAAESSLAIRTDYEGFWGANDSQTQGALSALVDRGLNIGPYTASRDMEMSTAQAMLEGNFLTTAGFAIPYFGGRLVPMLYDLCVGAWYPLEDEMLQAGDIDCYGDAAELERLAEAAGIADHPNFKIGPAQENYEQILLQMKADTPEYPYDFRLMSVSKCQELGLTYDVHAGGGTFLGSHDYFYPARLKKFGSVEAFRAHVAATAKYFLDFSCCDTWEEAEEYAKQFPPELMIEPLWE